MNDNQKIFDSLLLNGKIKVRHGSIFEKPADRMPHDFDFKRVEGMMLGLAIGDALGNTTEGSLPKNRRERHGEIRDYLPNRYAQDQQVGLPSDDTQLAFWTLEQINRDNGFNPENLANRFTQDRIFGIGATVRKFLHNFKSGKPWYECGPESAGNGALMRIAPMVVPHLNKGESEVWVDTALCAMMTHNDSSSNAACVSFAAMLWDLFNTKTIPDPQWWLERYVEIARELETGANYTPRGGKFTDYKGPAWKFVQEKCEWAFRNDLSVLEACNVWYSGAYLLETIPSVIFILMKHGHELEEAIIRAVNDTKDNDTVAAIVGAAVGALHGKEKLPERWISNLLGRLSYQDDGRVFELLNKAKKTWGEKNIKVRNNFTKFIYSESVLSALSINFETSTLNVKARLTETTFSIWVHDGTPIEEQLETDDFFSTFERVQESLKKMGLFLKVCGQCQHLGFSSMAHQMSGGKAGYCTLIKDLNVNVDDVVNVLDLCDAFDLREVHNEFSPWLPP